MNSLTVRLSKLVLPRVLARACDKTIPRSGEAGERVNCFVTAVDKEDGHPYLVVLGLSGDDLDCLEWDGSKYQAKRRLPLTSFESSDFRIVHYYGLSEVRYQGLLALALSRLTCWPYVKIHILRWLNKFTTYLFNKKKLVTKQRIELLKFLVDRTITGTTRHDALDLMTDLYTIRWVLHPDSDEQLQKLEFYLDSLADTGELKREDHKYVVTGLALGAIEEYEEQERRHTENVKIQWRMFWLTLAIFLLTVVQAGLIKLPALLDLANR